MATEKKLIKSEIGLVVSTFNTEENKNSILKKNELQLKMKNETYDGSNITQANNSLTFIVVLLGNKNNRLQITAKIKRNVFVRNFWQNGITVISCQHQKL